MDLHKNKQEFENVINAIVAEKHYDAAIVEKDYYVTLFLKQLSKNLPGLIFRGGTSLSKCYGIINRFSEDIDITVDFDGKLGASGFAKNKDAIKRTAAELGFNISNIEDVRTRNDFTEYMIDYPNVFTLAELRQHLKLDVSVAIKSFPTEVKKAKSIVQEFLEEKGFGDKVKEYGIEAFDIQTQSLDRTLVDKLFAIGDAHLKGEYFRNSRHIYDIYKILPLVKIDESFKKLVAAVHELRREERRAKKNKESGEHINHSCLLSTDEMQKLLQEIADGAVFRDDYDKLTQGLLYENVPYDTAITALKEIIGARVFN